MGRKKAELTDEQKLRIAKQNQWKKNPDGWGLESKQFVERPEFVGDLWLHPDLIKASKEDYYKDAIKSLPHLQNYIIKCKQQGQITVTYNRKIYGRWIPKCRGMMTGTYMWKSIRATLFSKKHVDIDMQNSHPCILLYICKEIIKQDESYTDPLQKFIDERSQIIKAVHMN